METTAEDLIEALETRIRARKCRSKGMNGGPCREVLAGRPLGLWCEPCGDADLMRQAVELVQSERARLAERRLLPLTRKLELAGAWAPSDDEVDR